MNVLQAVVRDVVRAWNGSAAYCAGAYAHAGQGRVSHTDTADSTAMATAMATS